MEQLRRVPPPPLLSALRIDAIVARSSRRRDKNDYAAVTLYDKDTQRVATAVLAALDDEGCDAPFGVDKSNPWRRAAPSFLANRPASGLESLDLSLCLTETRVEQLEAFEARVRALAVEASTEWFGSEAPMTAEDVDRSFVSCVRRPPLGKAVAPTLKASVVLSAAAGQEEFLTEITILTPSGPEKGRGWDWVEPRLTEADDWRRAVVWPTLEFRSLWFKAGQFGLRINCKELVVRAAAPRRREGYAHAFTDDVVRRLLSP